MLTSLGRWHQATGYCVQAPGTPMVRGQGATRCTYDYISHAIGLGIRYKTPVGPVRFDLGYNLNPTAFPGATCVAADSQGNCTAFNFDRLHRASPFNVYFSIGQTF
jgi:outer membrane protein insertion porin family